MPELAEALLALGLVAGGWLIGAVQVAVLFRSRAPKPLPERIPICGCDHHFSFHDESGCNAQGKVAKKWSRYGEPIEWKQVPCTCKRFVLRDDMAIAILPPGESFES